MAAPSSLEISAVAQPLEVHAYLRRSQWTIEAIGGDPVIRAVDEMTSKYGSCKQLLGVADDKTIAIIDVRIDTSADGPDSDRAVRAANMVLTTLK